MDYFAIIRTFWDEAPYRDGFKPDYAALFFAITDSVNRNLWKETEIEYDRIINKTKLGKRMYLDGRKWLQENSFISYTKGSNDYARARYNIVVQNCTSTDTSTAPQLSINCTPTVPYLNKTIDLYTNKPLHIGGDENFESSLQEKSKITKDTPPPRQYVFAKPTQLDVETYMESKYQFNKAAAIEFAEQFWGHYETNGWMVGKVKMKNWQSAISGTWKKTRDTISEKYQQLSSISTTRRATLNDKYR